ncbi:MAG: hypothetical protein V8Q43_01620 [Christensenellaceae bacterium]
MEKIELSEGADIAVMPAEEQIEGRSALSLRGQYDTMNHMQNAKLRSEGRNKWKTSKR